MEKRKTLCPRILFYFQHASYLFACRVPSYVQSSLVEYSVSWKVSAASFFVYIDRTHFWISLIVRCRVNATLYSFLYGLFAFRRMQRTTGSIVWLKKFAFRYVRGTCPSRDVKGLSVRRGFKGNGLGISAGRSFVYGYFLFRECRRLICKM